MFCKKKIFKNLHNINMLKKSHHKNLNFLYDFKFKNGILNETTFIYYNLFSVNFKNNNIIQNNFIFLFTKKKWHYSFNLIFDAKTIFFFTVGIVLNFLKILSKSLRRSKKGFSIYLNLIFNILKKFIKFNTVMILNFFDSKIIFFKKRLNICFFNKIIFIKLPVNSYFKFKKHKSIKRRLTKKFLKSV